MPARKGGQYVIDDDGKRMTKADFDSMQSQKKQKPKKKEAKK